MKLWKINNIRLMRWLLLHSSKKSSMRLSKTKGKVLFNLYTHMQSCIIKRLIIWRCHKATNHWNSNNSMAKETCANILPTSWKLVTMSTPMATSWLNNLCVLLKAIPLTCTLILSPKPLIVGEQFEHKFLNYFYNTRQIVSMIELTSSL